jgi:hypothetical protein
MLRIISQAPIYCVKCINVVLYQADVAQMTPFCFFGGYI